MGINSGFLAEQFPEFFGITNKETIARSVKSEKILEIKTDLTLDSHPAIRRVYETLKSNGFSVENFLKNLAELEFRHIANDSKVPSSYRASKNILYYRTDEELYHELSHMASTNYVSRMNGLADYDKHTIGINEGITDYFAMLSNEFYDLAYPTEYYVVSILQKIYGNDFFTPYFNSDVKGFLKGIKDEETRELINLLSVYSDEIDELIKYDNMFVYDKIEDLTEIVLKRDDLRNAVVKIFELLKSLVDKYKVDIDLYGDYIKLLYDGIENSVGVIKSLTYYDDLAIDPEGKYVIKYDKDMDLDSSLYDSLDDDLFVEEICSIFNNEYGIKLENNGLINENPHLGGGSLKV